MYGFGHGWGMAFGWLVPLIVIGILFYLLQNRRGAHKKSEAQDILDKRYANGGISKEEYEEKSRLLKEHK